MEREIRCRGQALHDDETRLIFVRHGQSLGNLHGLFLGHTDLDLSETGYEQAELACRYISEHFSVDKIYASDLMRAHHTVLPLARMLGKDIELNENFREIFAGEWEGKSFLEIPELYKESFGVWKRQIGLAVCDGGESVKHLRERVVAATADVAAKNLGKTVCIGSHATPIRALACAWKDIPLEKMHELPFPCNASISCAIYRHGAFARCECYSYDDYLGALHTEIHSDGHSDHVSVE